MLTQTPLSMEPLPGYSVVERIGAGGYGEVFRVRAPGGLQKALKIVYGQMDERRAKEELKALGRVKQVRHPFLLSLERIEIVDGRLIVVMELADESLKDRFNHHVRSNNSGIPRDDLLSYLRDAADALDFLCREHSLQHLDVKPENLLLTAGHVKVGDFGMVKDLMNTGVSLVAGLTPYYAAPEVFRGNPTRHSDQYSLAVLYQQMLTGAFPFSGATAAEITLQHLNDEPDLSSVSPADAAVLARALSKNPERRYTDCREFVEALREATADQSAPHSVTSGVALAPADTISTSLHPYGEHHATRVLEEESSDLASTSRQPIELPELSPPVETVVPWETEATPLSPAPTVFIGIGGAAARVLGHLRRRSVSRFGNLAKAPAIQTLLIDTDPKTLLDAEHAAGRSRLSSAETMALALRRPQDYRSSRGEHLRWISRRWLYNIPRSLRTHGIRPLGRLALVDHLQQATQRMRHVLRQATDEESVSTSREHTGVEFRSNSLKVYLIASVAGGTGSGMALDVAHTVRGLLAKLDLSAAEICGVFLHSTPRGARAAELAKINTFSWLTEFHYFTSSGGWSLEGPESSVLDRAYFAHLGDSLGDDAFDHAADAVGEFLDQDSFGPAGGFFDACRQVAADSSTNTAPLVELRTIGVRWCAPVDEQLIDTTVADVSRRVIFDWLGQSESEASGRHKAHGPATPAEEGPAFVQQRQDVLKRLGLSARAVTESCMTLVTAELACDERTFFNRLAAEACAAQAANWRSALVEAVDAVFWGPISDKAEGQNETGILERTVDTVLEPRCDELSDQISSFIWTRLDTPGARLSGAMALAEWLDDRLAAEGKTIAAWACNVRGEAIAELRSPRSDSTRGGAEAYASMFPWFQLRLRYVGMITARRLVRKLRAALVTARETLVEAGREIRSWADLVDARASASGPVDDPSQSRLDATAGVEALLAAKRDVLIGESSRNFHDEFVTPRGGMRELVRCKPKERIAALVTLEAVVRQRVHEVVNDIDVLEQIAGGKGHGDTSQIVTRLFDESEPPAAQFGRQKHRLVVLPSSAAPARRDAIAASVRDRATCIAAPQNAIVVCCEAGPLSIAHLAYDIIDARPDYADFARRVQTRADIAFPPLSALVVDNGGGSKHYAETCPLKVES